MGHVPYKAVIFDLGGVLVTDIWEPLRDWLVIHYGVARPALEEFGRSVVWGDEFACKPDHKDEAKLYRELINKFSIRVSLDELMGKAGQFLCPIAGMQNLLGDLKKQGVTIGICSNNSEFWYARQRDVLDLEQIVEPRRIVLSCRVGMKKPKPGIISEAVKAAGAEPAACVFIDDRMRNVLAAVGLGLTGIHVLDPSTSDQTSHYLRRLLEGLGVLSSGS